MNEFELAPERRAKVKRYYHELESGLLDPAGLDHASGRSPGTDAALDARCAFSRGGPDRLRLTRLTASRKPSYRLEALPLSEVDESPDEVDGSSFPALINNQRGMSSSYDEPRAHQLREAYHAAFGGDELPVPVESIAEDLLGLAVEVRDDLPVSGMLLPSERRIVVRSDEPEPRRRFTIAHELGHWICQCLEGDDEAGLLPRRGDRRRSGGEGAGARGEHLRGEPADAGGSSSRGRTSRGDAAVRGERRGAGLASLQPGPHAGVATLSRPGGA